MALRAVRFAFILPKGQLLGAGRRTCTMGPIQGDFWHECGNFCISPCYVVIAFYLVC